MLCFIPFSSKVVEAKTDPIIISTGEEDENLDEQEEELDPSSLEAQINAKYEAMGYPLSVITDIYDAGLYRALLATVKEYAQTVNGENYSGNTLCSEMLDMVTTIDIGQYNISTLSGMEKLELSNLESLTITRNALTSFDGSLFKSATKASNSFFSLSLSLAANSDFAFCATGTSLSKSFCVAVNFSASAP